MGKMKEIFQQQQEAEFDRMAREIDDQHNQIIDLEQENQALRIQMKWLYDLVKDDDHDCKASPDDGCDVCCRFWEIENLLKGGAK